MKAMWKEKCCYSYKQKGIMHNKYVVMKNVERKITYRPGENITEIDLVLFERCDSKYLKDVKVISGCMQHALVVAHIKVKNLFAVKSNTLNRLFHPYGIIRRESKTT